MTDIRYDVLAALAGQSPGYYAHPNASAFISEGLDPEEVEVELQEMLGEGLVEQEEYIQIVRTAREIFLENLESAHADVKNAENDKQEKGAKKRLDEIMSLGEEGHDHETVPVLGGFAITDKGRELLAAGEPDTKPKKVKQSKKRVE